MLNAMVIAGFDKSAGKSLIGIPSKVSLIKEKSLIKDKGPIDTRKYRVWAMLTTCVEEGLGFESH
jgi:hypothetical protein